MCACWVLSVAAATPTSVSDGHWRYNRFLVLAGVLGMLHRDNAITLLASRLARSVDQEGPQKQILTPDKVADVLLDWRMEQLANYKKW